MHPRQEPGTVLVVDDEETIRSLLEVLVQRAGASAVLAGTAAQAREHASAGGLDAAVIDKNLPDGSGLDLLRWLRASAPELPVLMITGYANVESAVEALRLGAFDYVIKPFDVAWVTRRIQVALEQRRLTRELAASREEARRSTREVVDALTRSAGGDPERATRVARTTQTLASALELPADEVESLTQLAPLADLTRTTPIIAVAIAWENSSHDLAALRSDPTLDQAIVDRLQLIVGS